MLYGYALAVHAVKPHHLHLLQNWSSLCGWLSVMHWCVSLWHTCHLIFVMQVLTFVARLLWHLVLRKGHALIHGDIRVACEDAQMKVCPCSPGASALNSCIAEVCCLTPSMSSGHASRKLVHECDDFIPCIMLYIYTYTFIIWLSIR